MKRITILVLFILMLSVSYADDTYVVKIKDGNPVHSIIKRGVVNTPADRIMSHHTDPISKGIYKQEGCMILHELKDWTAMACPKGLSKKLLDSGEAVIDRANVLHDLEADSYINARRYLENYKTLLNERTNVTEWQETLYIEDNFIQWTAPNFADRAYGLAWNNDRYFIAVTSPVSAAQQAVAAEFPY